MRIKLWILFLIGCNHILTAQTFTISGFVTDEASGETLIGANIYLKSDPSKGTTSNVYGFYSLTLPVGTHNIVFSYLGYQDFVRTVELTNSLELNVKLSSDRLVLDEIVITSDKDIRDKNVTGTQMGTIELPVEQLKKLPVIFGEVDILKTLQLLPGVLSSGEGTSGFYVRGGGPDQNLVLLDEAVVYNSGHLLGFFSVFNSDAIKNTTLIKGGMPAYYGGRLSSVLDIQMKEGSNQSYILEGGIGLISSRLTLQGPVVKDKSSFIISGRRTYLGDVIQPVINGTDFEGSNYYFYDLNAKFNYRLGSKDRIFFSTYFGRDILKLNFAKRDFFFDLPYGNATATLRWNHIFNNKLFFNLSAIFNEYDFQFNGGQENFVFNLFSGIRDWNGKLDFDYYPNPAHQLKFGTNYTFHTMTPNTASASTGEVDFSSDFLPKYAHDVAFYIQDDIKISRVFSLNAGLRYAVFSQVGPYDSSLTGREYERNEPVITYTGFEPRFSFKYSIDPNSSIKGGFTLTHQFLHLVSNSSTTLPTDIWVPSSELVKPQRSIQYALGYFINYKNNAYETSVEIYYRDLQNQIDYADDYVDDFGREVEQSFVFGSGRAYGAEFFVRRNEGKLTGWIGYTLSRTDRSFPDIEEGRRYPAIFDRRHDLSVVTNYSFHEKWDFGAAFIYGSGRYFTPADGFFFIEGDLNIFYGPRNSAQLPAYHRLDLSLVYTPKAGKNKKWTSSWVFSVYNAYNRKNPFFINYDFQSNFENGSAKIEAEKITIFPIIPSITYNFKWK
mgnify:CR=1 FL=1